MSKSPSHVSKIALVFVTLVVTSPAQAGLLDKATNLLDGIQKTTQAATGSPVGNVLGSDEIIAGLKEALRVGTEKVVSQVGQSGGYLADKAIHIPLPDSLTAVHNTLQKIGFGNLTTDLETRINRAAEKAAPAAKDVLSDAITNMTLDDAKRILDGNDTAATDYFRKQMTTPLTERFTPIINSSLSEVGAIQAYDQVIGQYDTLPFMPDVKADLAAYTVTKALDGLFHYIATEEAAIRANPAARTTDILKKVFAN